METAIEKTGTFVTEHLTTQLGPEFLFHNLRHTQRVVGAVGEILEAGAHTEEEKEQLLLAAWLHDTGYTVTIEGHEKESCSIAKPFLKELGKDPHFIEQVCSLIMATHREHEPTNELERIIRDADARHLSVKSFRAISETLREELSNTGKADYSTSEWRNENIQLFRTQHRYYTAYAQENWQPGKDKNLRRLIKDRKKEKRLIKKERLKAKFKNESPDRGIQTLYRTTLRNHIKLSDIADTKSNILLSVNAIIISLALSNLLPKLDNPSNDYLIVPTAIFIVFSIVSMILSISATRPNVTSGTFTQEDVAKKRVNLLFFGNFHKMKLSDYEAAIGTMLKDKDYIYKSLTKDLYYLGIVLERKYRILRWTYTIFMLGMILSVIAFGIAFKFYGPERIMEVM
ncbi:HD domain-containing protein [Flavobacteriaceae bacterium TP-CH-4]|uniref:HD domain-containing protein n=1 Tax=Pelagihabitans pacificus TaxID=2696054 RepID=A0A967AW38_9FLAO|nr:Pycsar system effector family protein [Pelagihabitans pacificus]NHF60999.1 HD domain-containing protein [Pelagihabitans pacificus]